MLIKSKGICSKHDAMAQKMVTDGRAGGPACEQDVLGLNPPLLPTLLDLPASLNNAEQGKEKCLKKRGRLG